MSTNRPKTPTNSIDSAIELVGDVHILCIIHHLGQHKMRFNQLQRAINGLNPSTLTSRLKKLENKGIIKREEETLDKISVVYELTNVGYDLLPIINEISIFAQKHL